MLSKHVAAAARGKVASLHLHMRPSPPYNPLNLLISPWELEINITARISVNDQGEKRQQKKQALLCLKMCHDDS